MKTATKYKILFSKLFVSCKGNATFAMFIKKYKTNNYRAEIATVDALCRKPTFICIKCLTRKTKLSEIQYAKKVNLSYDGLNVSLYIGKHRENNVKNNSL